MTILKEDHIGNFHISYEDLTDHHCLRLKLHGNYDVHCSEKVVRDTSKLLQKLNYKRCIIDLSDTVYDMALAEIFNQEPLWGKAGISKSCWFAYVSKTNISGENLIFLDNVFHNRGWHVSRFSDLEEAIAWLGKTDTGALRPISSTFGVTGKN